MLVVEPTVQGPELARARWAKLLGSGHHRIMLLEGHVVRPGMAAIDEVRGIERRLADDDERNCGLYRAAVEKGQTASQKDRNAAGSEHEHPEDLRDLEEDHVGAGNPDE